MAYIDPRTNKDGEIISYRIRVSKGYDAEGKRLKLRQFLQGGERVTHAGHTEEDQTEAENDVSDIDILLLLPEADQHRTGKNDEHRVFLNIHGNQE